MHPLRLLLTLFLLALAGEAVAAEAGRVELWRQQLGDEEDLGAGVDLLRGALEGGDVPALARTFRDGPLLLQIASLRMPPTLCGARQTRVLLADYFRLNDLQGLRVSQLRLASSGRSARVAFDLIGAPVAPGRPDRRRIVARFVRDEDEDGAGWQVAELRCP